MLTERDYDIILSCLEKEQENLEAGIKKIADTKIRIFKELQALKNKEKK